MSDVTLQGEQLSPTFEKLSTVAGVAGSPRLVSTGEATNVLPVAVILTDTTGASYVASGGGGGGGGVVQISDPTAITQKVAVLAPGSSGTFALSVQGVTGGLALPVSAASLPLPTGAATSAKQPALGTAGTAATDVISIQGIASMTAVKVDGSGVTQPVSAASLPLPSGAATAAKQPALGTAGTAATDVLSVQGIASMTALKVDGSAVTQPVSLATLPALVASTANIGQVGGKTAKISVSPTVTAAAYTTGNIVGGKITFSSALLAAGSGILQSIWLKIKTVQTATFQLSIFDSNPTNSTWTDKTAPAINVADIPFLVGTWTLSSPSSVLGTETIYTLDAIGHALAAGATTLYGILTVTGTPTFGSTSDVTVVLGILQD